MIATHKKRQTSAELSAEKVKAIQEHSPAILRDVAELESLENSPGAYMTSHHPKAGVNPLVDAACYLLSHVQTIQDNKIPDLLAWQNQLLAEINTFQASVKDLGYHSEYIVICRYIICALLDDLMLASSVGTAWEDFALLNTLSQDSSPDKFFSVLEHVIEEPHLYIDLMELIYLCLSLGYKGQYRDSEEGRYQLEQITNTLYKHIRTFRGSFSKRLSPLPIKASKKHVVTPATSSISFIFLMTACVIMAIFVSLGYLMDAISNEAYRHLTPDTTAVQYHTQK